MRQHNNIEHPDLSKLTDDELFTETQYIGHRISQMAGELDRWSYFILLGLKTEVNSAVSRQFSADVFNILDRQSAIIEEIQFRATSMR